MFYRQLNIPPPTPTALTPYPVHLLPVSLGYIAVPVAIDPGPPDGQHRRDEGKNNCLPLHLSLSTLSYFNMPESKEPVIAQSFISHLRQAASFCCPLTGCNDSIPRIDDRIRDHLQSKHCDLWEGKALYENSNAAEYLQVSERNNLLKIVHLLYYIKISVSNKRRSPITVTSHTRVRSDSPVRRYRAWPSLNIAGEDPDFLKRGPQHGKLWNPDQGSSPRPKPSSRSSKPQTQQRRANTPPPSVKDDETPRLIKQPETRPISQEQLVAEVKGIYAGLAMVESKCIEVDNVQSSQNDTKLNNEQWQALIALHRTLLHEHHREVRTFEPIHPYDGGHEDPTRFKYSKYRRGRGARRNNAYWKQRNDEHDTNLFDDRELLFQDEHGSLKASRLANLDTQLKIQKHAGDDLVMSAHCARDLGLFDRLSTDFDDPCLQSISGHSTAVLGVLRNVQFRLKGSSVTFRRDFWVCESLNNIVDVMIGANFIKDNFKMLFEKVKDCVSSFATWFSKKKETPEQKREREERERQQQIAIKELEIKRLQKESEALGRATAQNSGRQQGGSQSNGS
ncbi:hypothetical protein F4860DRAFT_511711 [Xylaria cubensis]|nr:hypothetical protein F4860DRAFT_511711 [Xylaria cubensis]